jgi:hypothetical protein
MGIALPSLYYLAKHLPQRGGSVLTLGVQDCHFTIDTARQFFKKHGFP